MSPKPFASLLLVSGTVGVMAAGCWRAATSPDGSGPSSPTVAAATVSAAPAGREIVPRSARGAGVTATATARLVEATPVATAAAIGLRQWSPDSRGIALVSYTPEDVAEADTMGGFLGFVQGTFGVLEAASGETCWLPGIGTTHGHEGPSAVPHTWLADGRLMATTADDRVHSMGPGCDDTDLTAAIPTVPGHYGETTPDGRLLVLGYDGWWLLDPTDLTGVRVEGIDGDVTDAFAWSPDRRHVAVKTSGLWEDVPSAIAVVESATGTLVARHEWEGMDAIGGVMGEATWMGNDSVLVPITLDQGPLLLDLDGNVSSALEPFGQTFEPAADRGWPNEVQIQEVQGHYDATTGDTHLLLVDPLDPEPDSKSRMILYHGESGELETIDPTGLPRGRTPRLTRDGAMAIDNYGSESRWLQRPLDPPGSVFEVEEQTECSSPWGDQPLDARWRDPPEMQLVDESCSVVERLRLPLPERSMVERASVSPDGRLLAVVTRPSRGDSTASLFVVPIGESQQ